MSLAFSINRALSRAGIQIVRSATLDRLQRPAPKLNRPAQDPFGVTPRGFQQKNYAEDLAALIPDTKMVFDVGAHDGRLSDQFSTLFPAATVHAFEPSRATFAKLSGRFSSSTKVNPHNAAVADREGSASLQLTRSAAGHSLLPVDPRGAHIDGLQTAGVESVKIITLDGFCAAERIQRIDLLSMDIQGGELRALHGAQRLLSERRIRAVYTEVLFMPLYDGQGEFHELAAVLQAHGLQLFDFYNFFHEESGNLAWGDALFVASQ